ncbi:hypothetical protein K438DRAFT_1962434 [Mycena galopus ATCC 62051]|nr:hypothetical protein K438DRAFT_1962434 [Mycena galopus ATCC 62051]
MFAPDDEELGRGLGPGPQHEHGNGNALQQALELAASGSSRLPSLDLERDQEDVLPRAPAPPPASNAPPFFEPLGDEDVYDVFDLELVRPSGGKEAGIDARFRSGGDSSSGRPTYKIQKKTRAHFLGKKNMTVHVSRSLAWDCTTATTTPGGSKSYADVFVARDQAARNVALTATNSVLCKTAGGGVVGVSTVCGNYDPSRMPRREVSAHHFFALKLNAACLPEKSTTTRKRGAAPPSPPPQPQQYIGGGNFVLDSATHGRGDLITTLYCTGYAQRPTVRAGDIAVAELCIPARPDLEPRASAPPANAPASVWARFFKERHAVLRVARRGLAACMTGPHVYMQVPATDALGRRAVLARGQALEVVLAVLGTAVLAVEHEGLGSKRWAWLAAGAPAPALGLARTLSVGSRRMAPLSRTGSRQLALSHTETRQLALEPLGPAHNPGLASPDGSGSGTDDSQSQSPSHHFAPFAGAGYSTDRQSFVDADGGDEQDGLDDWVVADDAVAPAHPAHPASQYSPREGAWMRKNSVVSEGGGPMPQHTLGRNSQHLKAGSWPEKTFDSDRRSMMLLERTDSNVSPGNSGAPPSTFSRVWMKKHARQPHPQVLGRGRGRGGEDEGREEEAYVY